MAHGHTREDDGDLFTLHDTHGIQIWVIRRKLVAFIQDC